MEAWHVVAFQGVVEMILAVNILACLGDHSEVLPVVGHQGLAVRKVWTFATVGGTVECQTLSLRETVGF